MKYCQQHSHRAIRFSSGGNKAAIPAGTAQSCFQPYTATGVRTASACKERTGAPMRGMPPPTLHTVPTARRAHNRQNRSPEDFEYAAVPCTARPVPEELRHLSRTENRRTIVLHCHCVPKMFGGIKAAMVSIFMIQSGKSPICFSKSS